MILEMRNSYNTQGLLDLIEDLPNNIDMIEIGSYAGESTEMFLKSKKINKLYAIDIWDDPFGFFKAFSDSHDFTEVENIFDSRIKGYDVLKLKMTAQQAMNLLPQVDFIYIDANHEYEYVIEDIKTSLKLIKPGGIISGHDYNYETPGVMRAVNEMFKNGLTIYSDTSWKVIL